MVIIKGFIVGALMLVPGVSGGTMCMIFNLYDRLISSVSSFFKHMKKSILFLLQFMVGAGAAFLLLSKLMTGINSHFPLQMAFFVIGAIIAGIPVIYKEAKTSRFGPKSVLYLVIGLAIVFGLSLVPKNLFTVETMNISTIFIQLLAGVLGALALVLPGISFSSMLYMMGVYNFIYGSIGNGNFVVLIPFAIGMVLGVLLLTRFLEIAMKKYPHPTYMIILGFVLGSIADIVREMPHAPTGLTIPICVVCAVIGFILIRLLSVWEERRGAAQAQPDAGK